MFLRGEIGVTPLHGGPIADETEPLVGKLVSINQLGVLTMDSQPGVQKEMSHRQRAYLDLLCHEFTAEALETNLRDSGLIVTLYSPGASASGSITVTVDDGFPFTFSGRWSSQEADAYRNGNKNLDHELDEIWGVSIVDPLWGKNRLWDATIRALRVTAADYGQNRP